MRKLVGRQGDPALLSLIEQIAYDLNYGFWSNRGSLKTFFEALYSGAEKQHLQAPRQAGQQYLGWLCGTALVEEPLVLEQALHEQENPSEQLGLFLDKFHKAAGSG